MRNMRKHVFSILAMMVTLLLCMFAVSGCGGTSHGAEDDSESVSNPSELPEKNSDGEKNPVPDTAIGEEDHGSAAAPSPEDEAAVSTPAGSEEPPQKPITPSEQEPASPPSPPAEEADTPETPTESENTGAASSGMEAWLEAKQAAQFQDQRLPVGPAQLTGEELKSWLSDPSSYDGYFVPTNYVEDGNGNTAYWGYWTGVSASEQFDLYCCFADGTEAALPLPRSGIRTIEPPASVAFSGQELTYQASFPDNMYADAYIHFAGTYTYTVDLTEKTVSLVIE